MILIRIVTPKWVAGAVLENRPGLKYPVATRFAPILKWAKNWNLPSLHRYVKRKRGWRLEVVEDDEEDGSTA